jgi:nitrate reductase beta subunit
MNIKAQFAMVMNLDKCIGCHTCSIPCKNVWTNRAGAEYIWYNNVETKPGIGYPKKWEDQSLYKGGWEMGSKLRLRAGGRPRKFLNIFHNPDLPQIDDYYEPWTYDYDKLTTSSARRHQPSIRPKSQMSGDNIRLTWGPNWEDDLAGVSATGTGDVNFRNLEHLVYLRYQDVFMFWLPRICEHCLNPACVASCPSGALYKREEDGIVLVDQERCRGWRYCVSGCPYKKVYFNWKTGNSEKCIFCYPRIEAGIPTLCAETCVGRIRSIGVVLYDADMIETAASKKDDTAVYPAHLEILLDPQDPKVVKQAASQGIPNSYIEAAQRSPVYKLAVEWKLAFPPHPEFRTLPMVWYVPPLSPLVSGLSGLTTSTEDIEKMRIPLRYLANLLSAGDETPVRLALQRLLALRKYMRSVRVEKHPDESVLQEVGMTAAMAQDMYRLLAVAKYNDRYVIPTTRKEDSEDLHGAKGSLGYP